MCTQQCCACPDLFKVTKGTALNLVPRSVHPLMFVRRHAHCAFGPFFADFNLSKVTEGAALNPSSTMGNVNPRWLVRHFLGSCQAPEIVEEHPATRRVLLQQISRVPFNYAHRCRPPRSWRSTPPPASRMCTPLASQCGRSVACSTKLSAAVAAAASMLSLRRI